MHGHQRQELESEREILLPSVDETPRLLPSPCLEEVTMEVEVSVPFHSEKPQWQHEALWRSVPAWYRPVVEVATFLCERLRNQRLLDSPFLASAPLPRSSCLAKIFAAALEKASPGTKHGASARKDQLKAEDFGGGVSSSFDSNGDELALISLDCRIASLRVHPTGMFSFSGLPLAPDDGVEGAAGDSEPPR